MKPVKFEQANAIIGEGQKEYIPLPAHISEENGGLVVSCWELTDEDIEKLKTTKTIWVLQLTHKKPVQPQLISLDCPFEPC